MHILAINPFHAGSHRAFLEQWQAHSTHRFDLLSLPGRHWKWRMRGAPLFFANEIRERGLHDVDAVFTTSMLDFATLRGLVPELSGRPAILFFHENQLTYPLQDESKRDYHYAFTSFLSGLCADSVWFNSAYHREAFLAALETLLRRMPDFRPMKEFDAFANKCEVQHLGVRSLTQRRRKTEKFTIGWVSRWEHDKNPDLFFQAMRAFALSAPDVRFNILGESFRKAPHAFARFREDFAPRIDRFGYQESENDYAKALAECDVVVSTANHEFFGLAVAEATRSGALPIVPNALAYPEVLGPNAIYHHNTLDSLVDALKRVHGFWKVGRLPSPPMLDHLDWSVRAKAMDQRLCEIVGAFSAPKS